MSEMTNGASVMPVETKPTPPKTKKKKPAKRASAASSKRGSARKKKPGKRGAAKKTPKHWSDTHAQLVMHASPELVAKLDRKLKTLAKRLGVKPATKGKGVGRVTRGQIIRALVEKACR